MARHADQVGRSLTMRLSSFKTIKLETGWGYKEEELRGWLDVLVGTWTGWTWNLIGGRLLIGDC